MNPDRGTPPDATFDLIRLIKRRLNVLVAATVLVYLIVIAVAVYTYAKADTANDALCSFRTDLEDRVDRTEQFLADNPDGVDFGETAFDADELQAQLDNQRRTVDSLADLSCE
jgi:hypothetical protein